MSEHATARRLLTFDSLVIEGYQEEKWSPIVKGVSLHLDRGEVLGLIGESGAGKSTLGIGAMGYTRDGCRIASGSVLFDGQELVGASDEALRKLRGPRIAYVAQSAAASFNPAHRIMQQCIETALQSGLLTRAEAETRLRELFGRLQLPDPDRIGNRYPHQVSGGQLQRAMIAMAMACHPDLIIFDEPTTALDVTTQIEVLASVREVIAAFDTAAIYITHDLAVVAQVADRICVLRYGNMVETGKTSDLLANPQEDYTRALLSVRRHRGDVTEQLSSDIVLDVDHLTAAYGEVIALNDVSVSIPKGKTVSIVGESGSGKSTLARAVAGLLPTRAGSVRFLDQELAPSSKNRNADTLRKLQMIYQSADTALNPKHPVEKIIGRPLTLYFGLKGQRRRDRVVELLEKIELDESYIRRLPSELSGGEKQRVCIARALAAEPDLIICDEITSALDQLVAEGILKLLQDLQNELSVSYMFITHDLDTVRAISDAIVVMHKGAIVEQGPAQEILSPPFAPYTDLLLSSAPEMDPEWLTRVLEHRETLAKAGVRIDT